MKARGRMLGQADFLRMCSRTAERWRFRRAVLLELADMACLCLLTVCVVYPLGLWWWR